MQVKLNIPDGIKVGFQNRTDTYTGKLGFIISMGRKDKKRKEDPKSWVGWRDKKIDPIEFDNIPTEGFVLNRDVGGSQRSYNWNARREKVRVFDPRNFEFEITVENLLLILQECSSIKGKGLEGEFVYAWSGSQLILLPITSNEYKMAAELIDLGDQKVSKKDIIEGYTYLTKDKVNMMYLGKHTWFDRTDYKGVKWEKRHVFLVLDGYANLSQWRTPSRGNYVIETGFTNLSKRTSDSVVPQYAEAYEELMKTSYVSKPVSFKLEKCKGLNFRYGYRQSVCVFENGKYFIGSMTAVIERIDRMVDRQKYEIRSQKEVSISNGQILKENCQGAFFKKGLTEDEVRALAFDLYVVCENGAEYKMGL